MVLRIGVLAGRADIDADGRLATRFRRRCADELVDEDLIDIQVVVADRAVAADAADAARRAGFVRVPGEWFGPGPEGRPHREEVCVDADPDRPVNVNIRPVDAPVWRNALLLRDWLRASEEARSEYAAMKQALAARDDLDIDGYGDAKATWVSAALRRAQDELPT